MKGILLQILVFGFVSTELVHATDKVIYGEDNRVNAQESDNAMFRQLSHSTAAMIPSTSVTFEFDGLLAKLKPDNLMKTARVCEEERFATQSAVALCSGFLVGDDLLVTAGHCVKNEFSCKSNKWIFDYRNDLVKPGESAYVDADTVYSCKKIINRALSRTSKNDFALIQLDRKVIGRDVLKVRKEGKVSDNEDIVVIGHPSGLTTIIADGANVRTNTNEFFFVANLDTFGGNSGSAVFNAATGVVEGILVRGETDYKYNRERKCYEVFKCDNDKCRGEDVTRITVIPELAPGMTPVEPPEVPTPGPRDHLFDFNFDFDFDFDFN